MWECHNSDGKKGIVTGRANTASDGKHRWATGWAGDGKGVAMRRAGKPRDKAQAGDGRHRRVTGGAGK